MKKITLAIIAVASIAGSVFGQAIITPTVPLINTATQLRLPNGLPEHKSLKGVMLLRASDLAALTAVNITGASFIMDDGTDPVVSAGTMSLWVENTSDVTNNKSALGFSGAIASMSLTANGNFNVSTVAVTSIVPVGGFTAFTYTGGGLYVAWQYEENTPVVNTNTYSATWLANNAGPSNGLCSTSNSSVALGASNTMTVTDFRPCIIFTANNTASNEAAVQLMYTPGKVEKVSGSPVEVNAIVKNSSIGALSNVSCTMVVAGANTALTPTVIPSIPAGGTVGVTFTYVPTTLGQNTVGVLLAADQNTTNNAAAQIQSVTCNEYAIHPSLTAGTYTSNGYGAGASTSGLIYAMKYTAGVNCTATGVKLVIPGFANAQNSGKQLYAVVLDATGNIVDQGNPVTIQAAMLDVFSTLSFSTPVSLMAGTDYYLGVGIPANGYFPIGNVAFSNGVVPGYVSAPTAGGSITNLAVGHLSIEGVLSFPALNITAAATRTGVCKASPVTVTINATGANSYTYSVPGLGNAASAAFTPTAAGSATLTQVTVVGGFTTGTAAGCRSNTVSVLFSLSACTGIADNAGAEAIKVMPNPAVAGKTTISNLNGVNTIMVFNTLGQVVINRTVSTETESIDLSNYPAGNYLVRITDSNSETRVVKLVNQN